MADLLGRHTSLPVKQAEDGMLMKQGHIYLLPPSMNMIVSGGRLLLSGKEDDEKPSYPIDIFFRSLASEYADHAVGVILSGTGSDGTLGAGDISRNGGLVIGQTAATAEFSAMPLNVEGAGFVNLQLPPDEMADVLEKFVRGEVKPLPHMVGKPDTTLEGDALQNIIGILQRDIGVDFSLYRRSTLDRRIARRAEQRASGNMDRYVQMLRTDQDEASALSKDFFIGVTEFFRDEPAFEELSEKAIHELVSQPPQNREIRVWVCGCATGEEAYSIAMAFADKMDALDLHPDIKIYATDIMKSSLDVASTGEYPEEALSKFSPGQREKFFHPSGDGRYRCNNRLRQMIVFAPHNVLASAPFTRIDLICCRNLLIYFDAEAQKRVLQLFHFGLREQGFLMLGKSESLAALADDFSVVSQPNQLYRKQRESTWQGTPGISARPFSFTPTTPKSAKINHNKLLSIYDEALRDFMPPGLVIDENNDLVHTFVGAEKYLRVKTGRASSNVLDAIEAPLRIHLSRCLQQIFKSGQSSSSTTVSKQHAGKFHHVVMKAKVLNSSRMVLRHALVVFEEIPAESASLESIPSEHIDQPISGHVDDLETELRQTRENLQTVVEELEASNEELQATNEELTASNEELQSSNEELHSVNEELHTVNEELNQKNLSLSEAQADFETLLDNIDIGVIFLDAEMKVRRFTTNIGRLIDLESSDIGRPIRSFNFAFTYRTFFSDIEKVRDDGEIIENEIRDDDGNQYLVRLLPYRREENVEGVVIAIINVHAIRTAEETIKQLSEAVEFSSDAIIAADINGKIRAWNRGAEELYGYSREEAVGHRLQDLTVDDRDVEDLKEKLRLIAQGHDVGPIEAQRKTKSGRSVDVLKRMSPIFRDGAAVGVSIIDRDFTSQKEAMSLLAKKEKDQRSLVTLLAGILDNLPDPLFVFDADSRLAKMSPDAEAIFAQESMRPKFMALLDSKIRKVQETMESYIPGDYSGVQEFRFDGEVRYYLPRITPITNHDGGFDGAVALLQDVTEFKMLDEVKSGLLGTVSHELRTPITSVRMALWMTVDETIGPLNETQASVLGTAKIEMERLLRTTNLLLDLTRFEEGFGKLSFSRTSPAELVRSVVSEYNVAPRADQPEIQSTVEEGIPDIKIDKGRIAQALDNIIRNAIKFSPSDSTIHINAHHDNQQVIFEVIDEGPGIPDEEKKKIFGKFYRLPEHAKRSGSGLGLSIVQQYVSAHKGGAGVNDNTPKGSRFWISLPAMLDDEAASSEES